MCRDRGATGSPATTHQLEIPRHLVAGNQYFDATPAGFQAYLNTMRATNPELYNQLAPDAEQLATRVSTARTILIAGFAAGLVSAIYAIAAGNDCIAAGDRSEFPGGLRRMGRVQPRQHDEDGDVRPARHRAGNGRVHRLGRRHPSRDELLDLVNRHNRISPQPLQLQLGYDPVQHLARAGAVFSF